MGVFVCVCEVVGEEGEEGKRGEGFMYFYESYMHIYECIYQIDG